MNKKYWYIVLGAGIVVVFAEVILFFGKGTVKDVAEEETVKREKVGSTVEELIQKGRDSEALDLITKTFIEKRPDYESIGKLGGHFIGLSPKELDKIFSYALDRYPQYTDELNIGWAWVLSQKDECKQALNKIKGRFSRDSFWSNAKQQVLDKCEVY